MLDEVDARAPVVVVVAAAAADEGRTGAYWPSVYYRVSSTLALWGGGWIRSLCVAESLLLRLKDASPSSSPSPRRDRGETASRACSRGYSLDSALERSCLGLGVQPVCVERKSADESRVCECEFRPERGEARTSDSGGSSFPSRHSKLRLSLSRGSHVAIH